MGTKISDLTELAAGDLASGDFFVVADTDAGTSKKLDADNVLDSLNVTSFVKTLLDDANAAAILTTLGIDNDIVTLSLPADTTISSFIKTVLDDTTAAAARTTLGTLGINILTGYKDRPQFKYSNDTDILIEPFFYHHSGTTEQILYNDTELTFVAGSGGSNGDSANLGNNDWHYIYLDDSAIVTAGTDVVTETEFINSTIAPTYNSSKHGWYNVSDRCIFAFLTDGSGDILEFYHDGDLVLFADQITSRSLADLDTTWTDVTLDAPGFCTRILAHFWGYSNSAGVGDCTGYWRTNGQSGTTGHRILNTQYYQNDSAWVNETTPVITDSSQIIEVKFSTSGDEQMGVGTDGWYFPIGM